MRQSNTPSQGGFTLMDWLVTMTILAILVTLAAQVCNSAQWLQCNGNRHLNADEEARALFDRMEIDFSQMIRRSDVDFWLKDDVNAQPGNDQLVFFSHVPGYYPDDSWHSPISVVGYRVELATGLQRYSRGLLWNGMKNSKPQMIFSGTSASSNISGKNAISCYWPEAIGGATSDLTEPAGPEVFRMEYFYVVRADGAGEPVLSAVPWDLRSSHATVNGMHDVAALGVVIALIDAQTRALLPEGALEQLAESMEDFSNSTTTPGALEARWQSAVKMADLPPAVVSSIRIYRRWFHLSVSPLPAP